MALTMNRPTLGSTSWFTAVDDNWAAITAAFLSTATFSGSVTISTLTSGRVPFASTAGLLTDAASLQYNSSQNDLKVGDGTTGAGLTLNKVITGTLSAGISLQVAGVNRIICRIEDTESGSDSGSNFKIYARTDAGVAIDVPFQINRATGGSITLTRPLAINQNIAQTGVKTFSTGTGAVSLNGNTILQQPASTSGAPNALTIVGGAHTALTGGAQESPDVHFSLSRTVQFNTGAMSNQRAVIFANPTYAFVGSSTITKAATVSITGAPVAGTNATIATGWALDVVAGNVHIGDGINATLLFGTGGWTSAKFDSQGTAWSSRALGPGIIFNNAATDRPEISWIRGGNTYPEFSVRQHTSANNGGEIWAGSGTVAPTKAMAITASSVTVSLTADSTSISTGAAIIAGGLGVAKNLTSLTYRAANVTATTAAADSVLTLANNSSGTPAAGYGSAMAWNLKSSTTVDQSAATV
jgi:hypothetical protein